MFRYLTQIIDATRWQSAWNQAIALYKISLVDSTSQNYSNETTNSK